ncbi:MAG: lipoyl synthase [Candidatus Omnitrophota bacterium]|nr:MAG: lipoyl synthase [Candidatus Omnitrophota bacterium]
MIDRLPAWFKQDLPTQHSLSQLHFLSSLKLNTVCREAKCPNLSECFNKSQLTFLILGDTCTRNCRFCNVRKSAAKKLAVDFDEPQRLASAVDKLKLNYVIITSVTRDDLGDAGAGIFARAIESIHAVQKEIKVELLIPDLRGRISSLESILAAGPEVIGHNIETVRRLYPKLRPQANYDLSIKLLANIKKINPAIVTKSSIMLGFAEKEQEVINTMRDLRSAGCDILTLGQYLAPTKKHYPVKEFISPDKFREYQKIGLDLEFKAVVSGPLVRSSYRAQEVYNSLKTMNFSVLSTQLITNH